MPHHEEAFVPAFLFQPTAIYDTPWKTFPVYHGTNLHELVLGEEEEQDKEKEKHSNAREGAFLRPCHQLTHRFAGVTYVCAHASSARTISRRMYFHRRFLPSLFLNLHRYCHYQFSKQCNPILSSPSCFFRLIFHVSYFPRSRREERERERERGKERYVTIVVKENFIS